MNNFDGSVTQTALAEPLHKGGKVEVHVQAMNTFVPTNAFFYVPLSPRTSCTLTAARPTARTRLPRCRRLLWRPSTA